MNYKHAIYLLFPYFVMAILGSITQLTYNQAGPGGEMISFLTEAGNPDIVVFDTPQIADSAGGSLGTLNSALSLANASFNAFTTFVKMAALDFDFFDQHDFFTLVRVGFLLLWTPLILLLTLDLMKVLTGVFRF